MFRDPCGGVPRGAPRSALDARHFPLGILISHHAAQVGHDIRRVAQGGLLFGGHKVELRNHGRSQVFPECTVLALSVVDEALLWRWKRPRREVLFQGVHYRVRLLALNDLPADPTRFSPTPAMLRGRPVLGCPVPAMTLVGFPIAGPAV